MGTLVTIGLFYLGLCAVSIGFLFLLVAYEKRKRGEPARESGLADVLPTTSKPRRPGNAAPSDELEHEHVDSSP